MAIKKVVVKHKLGPTMLSVTHKSVLAKKIAVKTQPEPPPPAYTPPAGAQVRYVLHAGPNKNIVRPAVIVDQGGPAESIVVHTEPDDDLPMPYRALLANSGIIFHADQLPGTWHWPPAA